MTEQAKAVSSPDELRGLYLDGIATIMGRPVVWHLMSADQQNGTKAMRDVLSRDDDVMAKLFAQFQKEQAMALDHAKCAATLLPFGIDFKQLYSDLAAALVKDVEGTAADLLSIVQAALNNAKSCPKMASAATAAINWGALWQAIKTDAATVLPIVIQIVLAVLAKQSVPA